MNTQTSLVAEQVRLQQWSQQIQDCQNRPVDMKVVDWCAQNGMTKANYYYRLRRVREACLAACETTPSSFVELSKPEAVLPETTKPSAPPAVILRSPGGIVAEISNSASSELIRNVIGAFAYA